MVIDERFIVVTPRRCVTHDVLVFVRFDFVVAFVSTGVDHSRRET
jgi:hypothetical protein